MSIRDVSVPRKRRLKKILSPSAKYEIWLRLVRGEAGRSRDAGHQEAEHRTVGHSIQSTLIP